MADINVVAENLVELLTNSVNMTDVFYTLFIDPEPQDVTLWQYNSENELVEVTVPNRAKDRRIALTGTVPPSSSEDSNVQSASVGVCYIDTSDNSVYFKIHDSGDSQWLKLSTEEDIASAISALSATIALSYVPKTLKINNKALVEDIDLTASDVGALSSSVKYGANLQFSNSALSLLDETGTQLGDSVNLSSVTGAYTDLSNITSDGINRIQAIKGYETGEIYLSDSALYNYINGLYNASSDSGTDTYTINGSTITIPYKRISTGSKVVLSTYESSVEALYEAQGYALYYVLDTTNQKVSLPKGELYGFIEQNKGDKLLIGSIVAGVYSSSYVPEGCLPCDGTEYNKSMYPDLWNNYLVPVGSNPVSYIETCTYTEYENELTTNGYCTKFAVNTSTNKFKVPTILSKKYQGNNSTGRVYGNGTTLGLTDGTNNYGLTVASNSGSNYRIGLPDLYGTSIGDSGSGSTLAVIHKGAGITTDGTKSGIQVDIDIEEATLRYYVVVSNGSINQSQMDWAQYASGLAGKANTSLSNLSNEGKSLGSSLSFPSNTYFNLEMSATTGARYVAPADGWVQLTRLIDGVGYLGISVVYILPSGAEQDGICMSQHNNTSGKKMEVNIFIPVAKGQTYKVFFGDTKFVSTYVSNRFMFIFAKGAEHEYNSSMIETYGGGVLP